MNRTFFEKSRQTIVKRSKQRDTHTAATLAKKMQATPLWLLTLMFCGTVVCFFLLEVVFIDCIITSLILQVSLQY